MSELYELIRQGSLQAWFFIPTALLLGALHGLEPGHSKTMMAAFIIAIRGTMKQAILLGLSATISHTAIVWIVALAGLYFGQQWGGEETQPWFELISGVIIIIVTIWMFVRIWRINRAHDHAHCGHDHSHEKFVSDPRNVTNGQIIMFGLTGGLLPCPAAITVLLLCLQVKQFALGAGLVLGFSIGLAVTLVGVGIAASYGARHATRKWSGFDKIAKRAPYFSTGLIGILGIYLIYTGLSQLL